MKKDKISWVMSLRMHSTVIKCISCAVFNHRVHVIHHKTNNGSMLNVLCYAKPMPPQHCLLFNRETPPPTFYSLQSTKILPADVLTFNRISDAVSAFIMHNRKAQAIYVQSENSGIKWCIPKSIVRPGPGGGKWQW